ARAVCPGDSRAWTAVHDSFLGPRPEGKPAAARRACGFRRDPPKQGLRRTGARPDDEAESRGAARITVTPRFNSFCWLDAEQGSVDVVGEHVEQAIRALAHVADALLEIHEHPLAARRLAARVQRHAFEVRVRQGSDEDIPLPPGESVARVEGHARDGDRGIPVHERRLEPRRLVVRRVIPPAVIPSLRDDGPAVVRARLEDVDLVAALRSVLVLEHGTGLWMNGEA